MDSVQHGYRGTGMVQVYNPRILEKQDALNTAPPALPAVPDGGPTAKQSYQNVQVLGDLSAGQFIRLMTAITTWVSPKEGCAYCHNLQNLAEDSKYTKVVARKMIEMTRHINSNWQQHVSNIVATRCPRKCGSRRRRKTRAQTSSATTPVRTRPASM
jgi:photosynthetic reaction center cytochrome c subunit